MAIKDRRPGQKECDDAIDTLNETITKLDQAVLAAMSEGLQPIASSSLQVSGCFFKNSYFVTTHASTGYYTVYRQVRMECMIPSSHVYPCSPVNNVLSMNNWNSEASIANEPVAKICKHLASATLSVSPLR